MHDLEKFGLILAATVIVFMFHDKRSGQVVSLDPSLKNQSNLPYYLAYNDPSQFRGANTAAASPRDAGSFGIASDCVSCGGFDNLFLGNGSL